jgi:heme-binding protein
MESCEAVLQGDRHSKPVLTLNGKELSVRSWIVRVGLSILVILVASQLVRVDSTNPPIDSDIPTSPEVKSILRRACYDCHSHETTWPWYSHIAPISWLLAWDVREGRAELNFSTWSQYNTQKQLKKLKESWEQIAEDEMPPWYYLPVHPEARLSAAERALLRQWAEQP